MDSDGETSSAGAPSSEGDAVSRARDLADYRSTLEDIKVGVAAFEAATGKISAHWWMRSSTLRLVVLLVKLENRWRIGFGDDFEGSRPRARVACESEAK